MSSTPIQNSMNPIFQEIFTKLEISGRKSYSVECWYEKYRSSLLPEHHSSWLILKERLITQKIMSKNSEYLIHEIDTYFRYLISKAPENLEMSPSEQTDKISNSKDKASSHKRSLAPSSSEEGKKAKLAESSLSPDLRKIEQALPREQIESSLKQIDDLNEPFKSQFIKEFSRFCENSSHKNWLAPILEATCHILNTSDPSISVNMSSILTLAKKLADLIPFHYYRTDSSLFLSALQSALFNPSFFLRLLQIIPENSRNGRIIEAYEKSSNKVDYERDLNGALEMQSERTIYHFVISVDMVISDSSEAYLLPALFRMYSGMPSENYHLYNLLDTLQKLNRSHHSDLVSVIHSLPFTLYPNWECLYTILSQQCSMTAEEREDLNQKIGQYLNTGSDRLFPHLQKTLAEIKPTELHEMLKLIIPFVKEITDGNKRAFILSIIKLLPSEDISQTVPKIIIFASKLSETFYPVHGQMIRIIISSYPIKDRNALFDIGLQGDTLLEQISTLLLFRFHAKPDSVLVKSFQPLMVELQGCSEAKMTNMIKKIRFIPIDQLVTVLKWVDFRYLISSKLEHLLFLISLPPELQETADKIVQFRPDIFVSYNEIKEILYLFPHSKYQDLLEGFYSSSHTLRDFNQLLSDLMNVPSLYKGFHEEIFPKLTKNYRHAEVNGWLRELILSIIKHQTILKLSSAQVKEVKQIEELTRS